MSNIRVLLARHARSEGNEDNSAYKTGDNLIDLTPLGWKQALHQGRFLKEFYQKTQTSQWPVIYTSDHKRSLSTLSAAMHGGLSAAFPNQPEPELYTDPRLIEQFFGGLADLLNPEKNEDPALFESISKLSKRVFKRDPYSAANLFGESRQAVQSRVKSFIDGSFARDIEKGHHDFYINTHGGILRAFIAAWFHVPASQYDKIPRFGNCDVIQIEGSQEHWNVRKIYDGEKMQPANEPVIDHIPHLTLQDLPKVPAEILTKFQEEPPTWTL